MTITLRYNDIELGFHFDQVWMIAILWLVSWCKLEMIEIWTTLLRYLNEMKDFIK